MIMKRLIATLALIPCLVSAAVEEGFTPLTNGKDLTGWKKVGGNGEYKMEGGEIVGTGRKVNANTFLISEKTYANYDFRFEMKFDTLKGNSGMMFRALQEGIEGWQRPGLRIPVRARQRQGPLVDGRALRRGTARLAVPGQERQGSMRGLHQAGW